MATTMFAGRVLIADDDALNRSLLRDLVESWGYQALVASDGQAALSLLDLTPDLALVDVVMPGMDGFEVLKRIRESPTTATLPVILLSAEGEVDDKLRGLGLGADDYVTKPFHIADLHRRITAIRNERLPSTESPVRCQPDAPADSPPSVGTYPQLKEALAHEAERARRYGRPLTALMVAINDAPVPTIGRQSDLPASLSDAIFHSFRLTDRIFRIDVDAFVALLPETTPERARVVAERLIQALETSFPQETGSPSITAWVGIAGFPQFGFERGEELVRAAYHAVKRAQRSGNARVEIAADSDIPSHDP